MESYNITITKTENNQAALSHALSIALIADIKKPTVRVGFFLGFLVGTRGFEPPTPDTP